MLACCLLIGKKGDSDDEQPKNLGTGGNRPRNRDPASSRQRAESYRGEATLKTATDAYIYGYPLITMEMTRRVMTNVAKPEGTHAPMGQFVHLRTYPTAAFRDITAPNADTLYSLAGSIFPENHTSSGFQPQTGATT